MIFSLESFQNFFVANQDYNAAIEPIISELMETNTTGKIKYIVSVLKNFKSTDRHHYFHQNSKSEFFEPQSDSYINDTFSLYEGLGPLEFSLASYLLSKDHKYDVIVLTGALGSGKSCLSNYVLNYIRQSNLAENDFLFFPKTGIIHTINFNENEGQAKEEVTTLFKLELINKLVALITQIHENDLFINKFIAQIRSYTDERYFEFSEFARKVAEHSNHTEEFRFNFLMDWLHGYDDNLSYKLRLVSYIITFIKNIKKHNGKVDFIFLLDNIDRLEDDAQIDILNIIFSFSIKIPSVKILVPMRPTTFGKIRGNGSFSFGGLQNTGQPPIVILEHRLRHFMENTHQYNIEQKLTKETFSHLQKKINFLLPLLNEPYDLNRVYPFYTAIAGNSIRRGLLLAERFFLNSVIHKHDQNLFQDDFLKALLTSNNRNAKFSVDDRIVNNLFVSQKGENSLLKIRCLQILNYFHRKSLSCNLQDLLSHLNLFEHYSKYDILYAINDLIFNHRKLIYIEGVQKYSDYDNMSQSMNDVIQITYSGGEYLNTLIYSPVYLQSAFITLDWIVSQGMRDLQYLQSYIFNSEQLSKNKHLSYLQDLLKIKKMSVRDFLFPTCNYSYPDQRMSVLRECLYFLMLEDLNQIVKYYENYRLDEIEANDSRYIKESIIIDIFAKAGLRVYHILKKNLENESEIQNWLSVLLVADLWQKAIFKISNKALSDTIKVYERG